MKTLLAKMIIQNGKIITFETDSSLTFEKDKIYHLTIGNLAKARSTGERSQNSCIHGWCADIAEQLELEPEEVYEAMKRMSVGERGYPTCVNHVDGKEQPMPQRYASVEQAQLIIETIKVYADMNLLWLTEYVNGVPNRLIGGSK